MTDWSILRECMASEHEAFVAALQDPLTTQTQQLCTILGKNRDCEYGRQYDFASIKTIEQYQARVPLIDYEQLTPAIKRMAAGEAAVLCSEDVHCFEQTGGSTHGAKTIPYTASALTAMRHALYPWLVDLSDHRGGIKRGHSYWSISPALRERQTTAGGIPIGMHSDAEYFGADVAARLSELLAAPACVAQCQDLDAWRYLTLRYLIASQDLSMMSVWSPTFLIDLLAYLEQHVQRFVDDIASGEVTVPLPADLCADTTEQFQASATRAALLRDAATAEGINTHLLWPQLDTISCWTQGSAQYFIPELQGRFPHVHIQGKGLMATEGFVTIPMEGNAAPVLALRSGFYEFMDDNGNIHVCTELKQDHCYEVILTSYAGLYRYRLGDRVRVRGWLEQTPLLEFIGRAGLVSDLCGEKLSEDFILQQLGRPRGFVMLLPALQPQRHYLLLLDAANWTVADAHGYADRLDVSLQDNPQYRYARRIGQLAAIKPVRVHSPWRHYADHMLAKGRVLGDIKPPVLSLDAALMDHFRSQGVVDGGLHA